MGTASGINKQVTYKKEVTYGLVPVAASAQSLRRVSSSLDLKKDTYQSNEIRPDYQMADFRHGIRKVDGAIQGELSAKTYSDFIAAVLKKAFTATTATTGASITIAGTAGAWTITRAAGSFLTDGIKIGDVIRLSAGSFNAANLAKNIMVTNVTALVITGLVLNASVLVAEGPIATSTVTVIGKKSLTPQTGHTDDSFSIEHWYPDVPASEVYSGCKVGKISFSLPPTGMATVNVAFMGKDVTTAVGQYFTSPAALTTTGVLAAVNGVLRVGGATVANVTGLTVDITTGQSGEPTVGSNTVNFMAPGRVIVTGTMTATFDSTTHRDAFINETEASIYAAFTADNTAASDFVTLSIPRIKYSGAARSDGEKTLTITLPFQALLNTTGGTAISSDLTTITIQDSQA
jgi:hypothetical protein